MVTRASPDSWTGENTDTWRFSLLDWGAMLFALAVAVVPFARVLGQLVDVWDADPAYSHCILIPLISMFLVWRERAALSRTPFKGSWMGIVVILAGAAMWTVAELSTIWVIEQYAFLVVLYGLVLALAGRQVFRRLWMALLILVFIIPLTPFYTNSLSLHLELLSSALGVEVIRWFNIPVYLDGNVIDLGVLKLQVAQACSGLRYLFPLMTLAFIVTYFFRAPLWKRVVLFLASVPIAIVMNSLRIGLVGVTVAYWGRRMAEGVLHYFEGWVVFMISTGMLLVLAAVLSRLGTRRMRLRDALVLSLGPPVARGHASRPRRLSGSFWVAMVLVTLGAVLARQVPARTEIEPARTAFIQFPMHLQGWTGRRSVMGVVYLNQLKLSDYLYATYRRPGDLPVNVWIAYYNSQRKGDSTHTPQACLPGGGWIFQSFKEHTLRIGDDALRVNRAVIVHGADRALMYYWFPQRGRDILSDYMLKWYLLWDSITRDRTDGALVRFIIPLPPGTTAAQGDRQLTAFVRAFVPQLPRFVPN